MFSSSSSKCPASGFCIAQFQNLSTATTTLPSAQRKFGGNEKFTKLRRNLIDV
ncbi:unnamed protein product [Brugia timori]|uniref:Uncharacterized protein n=1 Tax=Brugia timori TaxID=42155 RepID=A0A3P7VW58_9BILA|nr:unnamed protein product [Brugia timori]